MSNVTPSQERALAAALLNGYVYIASSRHGGRVDPRTEVQARTGEIMERTGWLAWTPARHDNGIGWSGGYRLTPAGRAIALTLPDRQSVASVEHYARHGRYLRYSDRVEFAPTPQIPVNWHLAARMNGNEPSSQPTPAPAPPPPTPAPVPLTLTQVLAKWDALQAEIKAGQAELEELQAETDYKSAEQAQDMSDGWTQDEAAIAALFVKAIRGEN